MCPEIPGAKNHLNKNEFDSDHIDYEIMNAYFDGVLDGDEICEIENHLASCEVCKSLHFEIHSLFESLEILKSMPVDIDIVSVVMDNLNSKSKFPEILKWGSIIQTVFVIIGLSILVPIFINKTWVDMIYQITWGSVSSSRDWFVSIFSIASNWLVHIYDGWPDRLVQNSLINNFHLSDLSLWSMILPSIILCIVTNIFLLRGIGLMRNSKKVQI